MVNVELNRQSCLPIWDETSFWVYIKTTYKLCKDVWLVLFFLVLHEQLGAMFDTIQRSSQLSSDWATLLFQLVSSGTITADSLPSKKYVI